MKPKNFPARKLARQIAAKEGVPVAAIIATDQKALDQARTIRTKKRRGG